jgi:hypothetical protein
LLFPIGSKSGYTNSAEGISLALCEMSQQPAYSK